MIPGYKVAKTVFMPKCDVIIHHKKHSYDEHGNVIVVDDVDEDRQQFIDSFADQVGLKNIMKLLMKQGITDVPEQFRYKDEDAVDVSGLPTNVNELHDLADQGDQVIRDALKQFNDAYGTNYTVQEFLEKSANGTLIQEVLDKQSDKKEEVENNG